MKKGKKKEKESKKGGKKDKKNKEKNKIAVHEQKSEENEDSASEKSKKSKKEKGGKKDKGKKKDKKKGKGGKKGSAAGSDSEASGLNDREADGLPTAEQILQIMQEEDLPRALREDAHILFDQAVRQNLDDEIRNVFKLFMQSGDSSFLVSHVLSASEEMMHSFCETNFSNNEIGALAKLRRLRSTQYRDAFQQYKRSGNHDELVAQLKEVIEEDLAQEADLR